MSDKKCCYYTDYCSPKLPVLILFILLMSTLDWGLTLLNLERGAIEANPLMGMAISEGNSYFFMLKYAMTSFGLLVLYLYKNFLPTSKIVFVIFIIYSNLILYHFIGYYFFT
ncbi:MAG: DUF5658 family protein [Deltaproteobacteria bacterium]